MDQQFGTIDITGNDHNGSDPGDQHVDGRTLRRSRNRMSVITALLELIREGHLEPGAAEIAERAGVSHRSVFRYFDDLDDLVRTAIEQQFSDAADLAAIPGIGSGSLDDRVAALVDSRLALFQRIDGAMRVARMRAPSIPAIDVTIAGAAHQFENQLRRHFDPELSVRPSPLADDLLDGCLVLSGYDAFDLHVRVLGHDIARTRRSLVASITALLAV